MVSYIGDQSKLILEMALVKKWACPAIHPITTDNHVTLPVTAALYQSQSPISLEKIQY